MNTRLLQFLNPENFELAWDKVATNNGCAGVDRETIRQFGAQKRRRLLLLLRQVASGRYRPLPLRQIAIPKKGRGWRILRVPTVRDRIVQQALLNVLHLVMEPQFEPESFAYRPGRSHKLAVEKVAAWHRQGYEWLLDADIVSYFDRVGHDRLLSEVKERLGSGEFAAMVLWLVTLWVTVPTLTPQGLALPTEGIPQGSVVSPILANIYLDDFDEALQKSAFKLVRFADDFVVMGKSQMQAQAARAMVKALLNEMGLRLHPDKTQIASFDRGFRFLGHAFVGDLVVPVKRRKQVLQAKQEAKQKEGELRIVHVDAPFETTQMQQALLAKLKALNRPIPPPLFVVLGYEVRKAHSAEVIKSNEVVWRKGMSTLYLVQQGMTVRKDHGRFVVSGPDTERVEVLIREVERILVFGNVQLTTQVIACCLDVGISVVYLSQLGDYKGHLSSAEGVGLKAVLAQVARRTDAEFQLETARAIVAGKLMNSKQLLLRLNRKRKLEGVTGAIAGWRNDLNAVAVAEQVNVIRGYEGAGAARYFGALGLLITNDGFRFLGRNRRPPLDPTNSLLSFGYTLLHNHILSLILAEGLIPYFGNLHGSERKQMFLAFDLIEEFRAPIVDALVIRLINRKSLSPTDFSWPNEAGGVYLQGAGRRLFLKRFEDRLSQPVSHPDVEARVSYRRVLQLQVQRYKRSLMGDAVYEPYIKWG